MPLQANVFSVDSDSQELLWIRRSKIKEVDLYSAFIVVPHTQGAQVRITQCYLQITPYLPLPRKHSPWRIPRLRLRTSNCCLLLIYLPRKDERLSRPGWLTYSGRFTHISGHPSAAGRVQDSESSPVRDGCSITVPRNHSLTYRGPREFKNFITAAQVIYWYSFFFWDGAKHLNNLSYCILFWIKIIWVTSHST